MDYNKTLNLPNTDFPMRAGLPTMEPTWLRKWEKEKCYDTMIENNQGKPAFILHDGPPYANAAIHLGTALNKVLKDFIIRYKNMSGFCAPYVPGWDTHGLPIELKAMKEYGLHLNADPVELRRHCHDFALNHVQTQKEQFQRLGSLGDYENPYLTLRPAYEARQIEIFGVMAEKGYIYKDLKTVHWCPECHTALAEAEIEYQEDPCDTVYVKFPVVEDPNGVLARMGMKDLSKTYAVIWTTTIWTLPANEAICLGPDMEYVLVEANQEQYLLARERVDEVMKVAQISDYQILGSATGKELEFVKYHHIFLERVSPLIVGNHVTLESGTGLVHTAPGHGVEDFDVVVNNYSDLGIIVPVDGDGRMTAQAGAFVEGKTTKQANKIILEWMEEHHSLLTQEHIVHQYPHCWRCHSPILFRATEQWFCSVEDFKQETLEAVQDVTFYPEWGKNRMSSMVADRNAWCISRQRVWGVPIPVFYCDDCGKYIINSQTISAVQDLFEKEGADAWYNHSAQEILPAGYACPYCGGTHFTKDQDIMDVWFDSGVSHAAVLESWKGLRWPADLYLEGGDQYRGWFQSSLLTAVAWRGKAPYKEVCTNGWVVDENGRKMSKSLGNGIDPADIVDKYGADILRLWVASADYHVDIRVSDKILKQLADSYRKIRNTARYMLGNLSDFNPDTDCVPLEDMQELDRWALSRLDQLQVNCHQAYTAYDFHVVYHAIMNFCTVDLSNLYLDIIKDRLYVEKADGLLRRSAQTALYHIAYSFNLLLAPLLAFTAEEIWSYLPHRKDDNPNSVVYNDIPQNRDFMQSEEFQARWNKLIAVRDDVNKALELARAAKVIGKPLEAKVKLYCSSELYSELEKDEELLQTLCIVSQLSLDKSDAQGEVTGDMEGLSITVSKADGVPCERCWTFSDTIGEDKEHPTLCSRCAGVVRDEE